MKRSNAPVFWLMFGAGGMLAALFGPALALMTGIAAPFGIGFPSALMSYSRANAFVHHPTGKLVLFSIIALFVWHGAERVYLILCDMHAGSRQTLAWSCYGIAGMVTVITASVLVAIGF